MKYVQGKPVAPVVVQRGIPIPAGRGKHTEVYHAALDMQVGDHIDIPYSRTPIANNLARKTGYAFTQRKVDDILRIWRTA